MSITKAVPELIQGVADEQIEPHSIVIRAGFTAAGPIAGHVVDPRAIQGGRSCQGSARTQQDTVHDV